MRGEWVDLPAVVEEPILPPLPPLDGEEWSANTISAWEAWRRDPVTTQWTESDIAYAHDTIMLHNVMTPSTASEVRLRMDALGLTPKGKRDLRWRTAQQQELEASQGAKPAPRRKMPQRQRLRAV